MDNAIIKVFDDTLNKDLKGIVISNSTDKDRAVKIKVRPVLLKGELYFQVSEYIGKKIFHTNYQKEELLQKLPGWFEGFFRQAQIETKARVVTLLISKKGKATIKDKPIKSISDSNVSNNVMNNTDVDSQDALLHNKIKNYILQEGILLPFLVDLGVMTKDGIIVKSKTDKFRQINRFLEYIEDVLPYLDKKKELTIIDFGCGKSYLTFAMYYYLKVLKGYQIKVIGLDLKSDVISRSQPARKRAGFLSVGAYLVSVLTRHDTFGFPEDFAEIAGIFIPNLFAYLGEG
jgi:hypothetical protein